MKTKVNKWLRGNEAHTLITSGKGEDKAFIEFMRVSVREGLDVLYYRHSKSTAPELRAKFEYGGIYDRRNKLLYCLPYSIPLLNIFDTAEEHTEGFIIANAQQRISDIVDAALDNNRDNLRVKSIEEVTDESALASYNGHIEHYVGKVARKMFLEGNAPEDMRVSCNFRYNDNIPDKDMLDWIIDAEAYCQRKATEYFNENQDKFYTCFLENDATKAEMQKIIDDPTHEAHTVKAIMSALNNRDCKSVMVTVIIDGKELTFCTTTKDLRFDPEGSSYSTLKIAAPDRKKFAELFGNSTGYRPEHITKITYSKAVLYERPVLQSTDCQATQTADMVDRKSGDRVCGNCINNECTSEKKGVSRRGWCERFIGQEEAGVQ